MIPRDTKSIIAFRGGKQTLSFYQLSVGTSITGTETLQLIIWCSNINNSYISYKKNILLEYKLLMKSQYMQLSYIFLFIVRKIWNMMMKLHYESRLRSCTNVYS